MILDTNALSAFGDGDQDVQRILATDAMNQLPVPVLGEYRFGLQLSRERKLREPWLDRRELEFEILSPTANTAREYASIRAELKRIGRPIPENDLWIAALAKEHGLAILSKDVHFDVVPGIRRIGW